MKISQVNLNRYTKKNLTSESKCNLVANSKADSKSECSNSACRKNLSAQSFGQIVALPTLNNTKYSHQMTQECFDKMDTSPQYFYSNELKNNRDFINISKMPHFSTDEKLIELIEKFQTLSSKIIFSKNTYTQPFILPPLMVPYTDKTRYPNPTLTECIGYVNKALSMKEMPEDVKTRVIFNADELDYHKSILKYIDSDPQRVIDETRKLQYKGVYPIVY